MKFGVALPQFGPHARGADVGERILEVARAADELGYDVVWTAEHLIFPRQIESPYPYGASFPFATSDPILDVAATLAHVAAVTYRVQLGSAVIVLPYHHPIALAKALATVDLLSGGRLLLGVASGWLREEFELLGMPFAERGARTDESIELMRALWTQARVTFRGRFFTLEDADFFPKPAARPCPPIWIGGASPAALERVARLGDGWLAVPGDIARIETAIGEMRAHAERARRDVAAIGVASSGGSSSIDELLDLIPRLERIGVTIANVPALFWAGDTPRALDLMQDFAERARLPRSPRAGLSAGQA